MSEDKRLIYGLHAVTAALKKGGQVEFLWLDQGRKDKRLQAVVDLAQAANIPTEYLGRVELSQLCGSDKHQGVVARCLPAHTYDEGELESLLQALNRPFVLVLDGLQDPHNLGACMRSADGAGVDLVIIPKDKSVSITPVVRKVAAGAMESVPLIRVTNLARTLRTLKDLGIWLVGAAGESDSTIYELDLTGPLALVLGGEGKGLRRLTREHCDHLVSLPMAGSVESLNVSVATGICLYEAVRQRCQK